MNRQEFANHVAGTQAALRRFLCTLCCGDAALADDIAQETYIKAYLALDSFRGDSSFGTWIHRIACNEFISNRRRYRECVPLPEAEAQTGGSEADEGFRYQTLYAALARLGDRDRTVVTLFYLEGYATKEIAEATGMSDSAVRQTLSRARTRLRDIIQR